MRTTYWAVFLAAAIACSGLMTAACGDDDSGDSTDSGPSPSEGGPDFEGGPNPDGGPGGCTFATYVIGLVNGSTNATASPDTTLGAGCKDTTTQAEFKSLFP